MDTLTLLLDFILHIDRYLEAFVQAYGVWIYVILFLIVFVETGLVVMPFCRVTRCFSWWVRWLAPSC
jgi:membrane-associated protein